MTDLIPYTKHTFHRRGSTVKEHGLYLDGGVTGLSGLYEPRRMAVLNDGIPNNNAPHAPLEVLPLTSVTIIK